MSEELEFRADLYRGTATFYDRCRLPYPAGLIGDLVSRTSLDGTGRVLDVACGTGQIAFAVRAHVAEVVGIDQEREMVEYARDKALRLDLRGMQWVVARAEDFAATDAFRLVTIGNAFHRLQRGAVAERARRWLTPDGHLALVWSSGPQSGRAHWQRALDDCAWEWVERSGEAGRLPPAWESVLAKEAHVAILRAAGFEIVGRYEFDDVHDWTLDELAGWLYSTSFFPRAALGGRAAEFEADLARRLLAIEPSGIFREEISAAYDLAVAPQTN
jgi:ubiquinone/menaquinone biosynthesis C-methylase UbiE